MNISNINVGRYKIQDKTIKVMRNLINESDKKKVEIGFAFCKSGESDVLSESDICYGNECKMVKTSCDMASKGVKVGSYHTHCDQGSEPSIGDLDNAYYYGVGCIGGVIDKKISCYNRKVSFKGRDVYRIWNERLFEKSLRKKYDACKSKKDELVKKKLIRTYQRKYNEWENKRNRLISDYFDVIELNGKKTKKVKRR